MMTALLLMACSGVWTAEGATLIEDFNYESGQLAGKGTTVDGWTGSWGAGNGTVTGRILVTSESNLSYSGGGYGIVQSGVGKLYGNYGGPLATDFRSSNRAIAEPMSGTIWFSLLLQNNSNTTGADHWTQGIQFNKNLSSGNNFDASGFRIALAGTDLQVTYNGVTTTGLGTYALDTTHLIVGKLEVGTGNDTLSVWLDPVDLLNLGTAVFTQSNASLGNTLANVGVFSYGTFNPGPSSTTIYGSLDALRVSDGGGVASTAFLAVTGVVPEPGRAWLTLVALAGVVWQRRRLCRNNGARG